MSKKCSKTRWLLSILTSVLHPQKHTGGTRGHPARIGRAGLPDGHLPRVQQVRQREHLRQLADARHKRLLHLYQERCGVVFLLDQRATRGCERVFLRNGDRYWWNTRQMLIVQPTDQLDGFGVPDGARIERDLELLIQTSDFALQDVRDFRTTGQCGGRRFIDGQT